MTDHAKTRDSSLPSELQPLVSELRRLHAVLHEQTRAHWNRSVPLEELLFDRWERAQALGFGDGTSIYQSSYVYGDVRVGRDTWIGPFTLLDGSGGLEIGSHCSISAGVQIYTHDTVTWALSGGVAAAARAGVHIGDCSYIGSQSVVAKGVSIGDHCVIGACSFVNRSLPPFTVAFGVPCRPRGRVRIDEKGEPHLELAEGASSDS